jgi:Glycosyl hydrolase family 26
VTSRRKHRRALRRRRDAGARAPGSPRLARSRVALLVAAVLAGAALGGCEAATPPDTGLMPARPKSVPLGVFHGSGATRDVAAFGTRLGRRVDLVHDYLGKKTWAAIADVSFVADRWREAGFAGRLVLTVPMIPDSGGSLANGAAGRYNTHFRLLASRLVSAGQARATLRLGHEFNGTWFPWTINVRDGPAHYAAYWRQIVRTMRSVQGARFRFDWAPNAGSSYVGGNGRQLSAASAYPGDAYVDFIGLDVFDQSWADDTSAASERWKQLVRQKDGLNWQSRFASAHHKPMTFPEWGLVERRDSRGGGDNPYFVERMHEWIQTHPVAYHLYFESRDPNGDYRVFGGSFPKAAKRFILDFGSQQAPPAASGAGSPVS